MASGRIGSEGPLGREHTDDARVALRGGVERASQRLEYRLDDVVRVPARGHADVEVHARLVGEREEEVVDQLDVEGADLRLLDADVVDEEGSPREVDHRRHQRLVERHASLAEAADAGLLAGALTQRLAEGEPDVLDRVVVVDLQVARRAEGQVEEAVLREQLEHVVQKRDAGLHLVAAAAVEGELETDVGLLGLPRDARAAYPGARRCPARTHRHQRPPAAASRRSTASPCASRPSRRARRITAGPSRASVRGPASITLVRLTKS